MLHVLVAYDDADLNRGEYFNASQENLISKIIDDDFINQRLIDTNSCSENSVDHYTSQFGGNPFIFVSYVHGSEDSLFISDTAYIQPLNAYLFSETLFYACSCLSAKQLGNKLIEHGCRVFLGYNSKITNANNETEPIFYECENALISHFLTTENTIQDCLDFMYDKYQEMERHLVKNYGVFDAGILGQNLNAFEIICDDSCFDLTKRDFISQI